MRSRKWAIAFARDDSGVRAVEYGLIAAAVSAAIVVAAFSIGDRLENAFNYASSVIDSRL